MGVSHLYVQMRTAGKQRAQLSMREVGVSKPYYAASLCRRQEVKLRWESGLFPKALPPHLCIVVCCEVDPPREACIGSRHTLRQLLVKT